MEHIYAPPPRGMAPGSSCMATPFQPMATNNELGLEPRGKERVWFPAFTFIAPAWAPVAELG